MRLNRSIQKWISLWCLVALFGCSGSQEKLKPPRGYLNEGLLKAAYLTKMIKLTDTKPEIPQELEVYKEVEYKIVDATSLKLDIYKLKAQKEKSPVLLFIHGGSWKKGKRQDCLPYLIDYAMKGYVTATVSYRLSGVAKYPAALEDVKCAIKWLKDHADEYNFDASRMALVGGSAGGHLALLAGYDDHGYEEACSASSNARVKAIVNLYGPVDLTTPYARARPETTSFLGKTYDEDSELFVKASPKTYISSDAPPTLIFHGTIDSLVPISQSDSLNIWLNKAGIVHEYHRLKGWPHSMDLAKEVNEYCQLIIDGFLKEHL
jgi:acetyl esterase/lipase